MKPPRDFTLDRRARMLTLHWPDGVTQRIAHRALRLACRCASCERIRRDGAAPDAAADVEIIAIHAAGYGAQFEFSDGHARGIFPWPYLERVGAAADDTMR